MSKLNGSQMKINLQSMMPLRFWGCLLFLLCGFWKGNVQALEIDITQGTFKPIPIILFLEGTTPELAQKINAVIQNDLEGSGLFQSLNRSFLPQNATDAFTAPTWSTWKQTGGQILLVGNVEEEDERIVVKCRLLDILNGQELLAFSLGGKESKSRRVAHQIADEIYKRLTGYGGYFNTQLVYVSGNGKGSKKAFRISIMDQDGWNPRELKIRGHLLKGPQFSPSGDKIVYIANKERQNPQVFIYDLKTEVETLIPVKGRVFAARFMPGKDDLVLSIIEGGRTTLGLYSLSGREVRPLIQSRGLDTSPSCAPDGLNLVFNSDRGGSPQLYRISTAGGEPQRLSWDGRGYFAPAWSPKENRIAFVRRDGGFFLGVMSAEAGQEKLLASFYIVDTPAWAPNGQVLVFSAKRNPAKPSKLYSIDLTSRKIREIPTSGEPSEPAWSPLSQGERVF